MIQLMIDFDHGSLDVVDDDDDDDDDGVMEVVVEDNELLIVLGSGRKSQQGCSISWKIEINKI